MNIRIKYLRSGESTPRVLELTPEEYFDPLDEGEVYDVRSIPKYWNDFEYITSNANDISWTLAEIVDGDDFWRVKTFLLDGTRTRMTHSQSSDGSEEIIHSTELTPDSWHTVRTLREPGKEWTMVVNDIMRDSSNQPLEIRNFCGNYSFEQLKAFGNVR